MGGFVGFLCVYGLLESFTVYEVDAQGVTRRGWNGARTLFWPEIARFEANGQDDSELTFVDAAGSKISIQRGLLGAKQVGELNVLLEPHLAVLRERQKRDIGVLDNVYRPKKDMAWAGVFMSLIVGLMLLFIAMQPLKASDYWAAALVYLFLGSMELLFLYATVHAYTDTLTVTAFGLVEKDLFKTREIRFGEVTSLMSRTVQSKSDSWEVTTIQGNGVKIALTAKMKDYDLLLDYIRAHSDTAAKQEGVAQAKELKRKNDKQTRVLLPILAGIYMVFLCGVGLKILRDGNEHMEHYRLMDAQGRTTTGQITGKSIESGSKHTTYLLRYAFNDSNGQRIESLSPVSREDYAQTQAGTSAQVIYVPGRRDVSRLEQSVGRKKAEADVRSGYLFIIMGVVFPLLLTLTVLRKRKTSIEDAD